MQKVRYLLVLISFLFIFASVAVAIEDPSSVPNNKFGIHIIDENDLSRAAELVNSSGGDWGYITVVIREDERNSSRWQEVFDRMRRLHLIPIIRIATKQTTDGWTKPISDEIDGWINFFNSLNWVVKNRYVVVGNEPNQSHEWGGEIKPDEYANYLKEFSSRLKGTNSDYFILPAGLDSFAPNTKTTMAEEKFITEMVKSAPDVFNYIDGWTSHSYPSQNTKNKAKSDLGSVLSYAWEIRKLESLGQKSNLPVFITETGWKRNNGLSEENIQKEFINSFENVWNDKRVVAVTPFLLKYLAEPFKEFSWIDAQGEPYQIYREVQGLKKTLGSPTQITDGKIDGIVTAPFAQAGKSIYGVMIIQNSGQSIWEEGDLGLVDGEVVSKVKMEPGDRQLVLFKTLAPDNPGFYSPSLVLKRKSQKFGPITQIYTRVFKFTSLLKFLPHF